MSSSDLKVVIIGCGVSGLILALSLRVYNIQCEIYEMRPEGVTQGGGINLFPNTLRILDGLGVFTTVHALGFDTSVSHLKDTSFKTIRILKMSDHQLFGYNSLRIERDNIVGVLAAAARERGVPIYYNHKLASLREDESEAKIEFENGVSTSAKIVVGADGIWSKVRRTSFPDAPGPSYTGQTSFTWIVPRSSLCFPAGESLPVGGNSMMITPHGMALFISDSIDGQRIRVAIQRPIAELDSEGLKALYADKTAVQEALVGKDDNVPEPLNSAIALASGETNELFLWPFYRLSILSSWVSNAGKGRVVILGDAAHAFPPAGGQGAGMATEDAAGLGLILGQLSKFESIEEALSVWEKIRRERVGRVGEYVAGVAKAKSARPDALSSDDKKAKPADTLPEVSTMGWLYNWKFQEELDRWMETREFSV